MLVSRFSLFLLLVQFTLISCMSTASDNYQYADGSGNVYRLSSGTLEYVPVTPERSSSGIYSGGEPQKADVTTEQFGDLKKLFEKAISDTPAHQQDREMMTGLIVVEGKSDTLRIVLKKDSPHRVQIETALKRILRAEQD